MADSITTDTLGALNAAVTLNVEGSSTFGIDVRGTFVGTLTFQGTLDGVNWITAFAVPLGSVAVNTAAVSTATAAGAWAGACHVFRKIRAIFTAYTSGAATVILIGTENPGVVQNMPTGGSSQAVSVSSNAAIVGQAAHDAAITGSPVRVAGRAVTANYAAVASGDVADLITTLVGAQIMKAFSIPELDWQYTAALTTASATAARAAGAAGIRNYVTGAQFSNSGASAIDVIIIDGATEIWRATVAPNGFVNAVFQTPLRGTAATALNVNLSAVGTVRANVQGYQAP